MRVWVLIYGDAARKGGIKRRSADGGLQGPPPYWAGRGVVRPVTWRLLLQVLRYSVPAAAQSLAGRQAPEVGEAIITSTRRAPDLGYTHLVILLKYIVVLMAAEIVFPWITQIMHGLLYPPPPNGGKTETGV